MSTLGEPEGAKSIGGVLDRFETLRLELREGTMISSTDRLLSSTVLLASEFKVLGLGEDCLACELNLDDRFRRDRSNEILLLDTLEEGD